MNIIHTLKKYLSLILVFSMLLSIWTVPVYGADTETLPNDSYEESVDEESVDAESVDENADAISKNPSENQIQIASTDESSNNLPNEVKNTIAAGSYGSGSYMLNQDNEKYRFYTEYFANGNKTMAGSQRINKFFVYMEKGEYVLFGSSVANSLLDVNDVQHGNFGATPSDECKDIVVTDTDGVKHGFDVVENGVGYIANRDNEVRGPKIAASDYTGATGTGKYEPLVFQADKAGVYTFAFHSVYGNNDGSANVNPNPAKCKEAWNQTKLSVAAWDITVAGKDTNNTYEVKTGRVWSNYLSLNSGAVADCVTNLNLFILTKDGIQYKVNFNDIVPFGFQFFANNLGFTTTDGKTPIYHSFYDNDNRLDNPESEEYVTFHKPSTADTSTQVTHTLFFEQPSAEAKDAIVHGTDLSGSQSSVIGNYHIRGYTDNRIRYGTGADISFDVAYASSVTIQLDFRNVVTSIYNTENNAQDQSSYKDNGKWKKGTAHYYLDTEKGTGYAEISGAVVSGTYTNNEFKGGHNVLHWDGKDSAGSYLPLGVYNQQEGNEEAKVEIKSLLKKGEIHFPFIDVEGLRGGVTIENQSIQSNTDDYSHRYDLYYNNYPLTNGTIDGTNGTSVGNYYTLSDGTRSYNGTTIKKNKKASTQDFFHYGDGTISTLTAQSNTGFGTTYIHNAVDSSQNTVKFDNYQDAGGGDQAGIDIWTYYSTSQVTYAGTYLNFEITADEYVANIEGRVFYDNDLNGVWTEDDTDDTPLDGIIVRLLDSKGNPIKVEKTQNVIDEEGNFLYDDQGNIVKENVVVYFEAETDANGLYRFNSVPFDAEKGTTYYVQVMLSKLETEYKMYVCTSTADTKGSMVGEEKAGVRTYLTETGSVKEDGSGTTTAGPSRATNGQDGNTVQLKEPTSSSQQTESGRQKVKILSYQRYDSSADAVDQKKWDGNGEVVFKAQNAQSVTLTSADKNNTKKFNDIGYISTINPGDLATMVVKKNWGDNDSGGLTELNLQLWEWDPTVSAVEEDSALGVRTRGGHLIDTVAIKESNQWEHRWHNLDKSKAYYVIETYNKYDAMGVAIKYDNGKSREVMIGSTFPMFASPEYARSYFTKYQNEEYDARGGHYKGRLYRAAKLKTGKTEGSANAGDYEQDTSGQLYYVFPGRGDGPCNDVWVYDSSDENATPKKMSGLHKICYFGNTVGPTEKDHYQAEVLWETMTDVSTNSRQYNMTFDLQVDANNDRVLTFNNKQTFDEESYYIWQGHNRELPYFISKTKTTGIDNNTGNLIISRDNEQMVESRQSSTHSGKLIKGVIVTQADNAKYDAKTGIWSGVTGGDATDDFTYVGTPVECTGNQYTDGTTGDKSIAMFHANAQVQDATNEENKYRYTTGTHTFIVDYVTDSSGNPVEVKISGGNIVLAQDVGSLKSGTPVYQSGSTQLEPKPQNGLNVYRWNMTIYIYNVDNDEIYEYDPGLLSENGEHEPLEIVHGASSGTKLSWNYDADGNYVSNDQRTEKQQGLFANDTFRVPAFTGAVSNKMNACADLIGIAYSPNGEKLAEETVYDQSKNENNAHYLTYWDTNEYTEGSYTPVNSNAKPNSTQAENLGYGKNGLSTYMTDTNKELRGEGGPESSTVHAKGGDMVVTLNTPRTTPVGNTQDHMLYANVNFIPNGTSVDDPEYFYYKVQVFGENALNDYLPYYTLDATKGVALYASFGVKQASKTNASIQGATLSVSDQIDVNFYATDVLEGMREHYYMEFSDTDGNSIEQKGSMVRNTTEGTMYLQQFKDGVNLTLEAGTEGTEAGANGNKSGKKLYGFTFMKLNAYEMGKDIVATLYYSEDGQTFVQCGKPVTYSIAQYAYNILRSDQYKNTKLYRMLLDMLNYGAAAQNYAESTGWLTNKGTLVNINLGNNTSRADNVNALKDTSFKNLDQYSETVSGSGINNLGVSVILEEGMRTALKIRFEVDSAQVNLLDYQLKIHSDTENLDDLTYNGLDGNSGDIKKDANGDIILTGVMFKPEGKQKYSVTISGVPPFYWNYDYELTFIDNSKTAKTGYELKYSVFDYCNAKQSDSNVLGKLVKAMYNYGMTANLWRQDNNEGTEEVYKDR